MVVDRANDDNAAMTQDDENAPVFHRENSIFWKQVDALSLIFEFSSQCLCQIFVCDLQFL